MFRQNVTCVIVDKSLNGADWVSCTIEQNIFGTREKCSYFCLMNCIQLKILTSGIKAHKMTKHLRQRVLHQILVNNNLLPMLIVQLSISIVAIIILLMFSCLGFSLSYHTGVITFTNEVIQESLPATNSCFSNILTTYNRL